MLNLPFDLEVVAELANLLGVENFVGHHEVEEEDSDEDDEEEKSDDNNFIGLNSTAKFISKKVRNEIFNL
jgi:hypothetical protein